MSKEASYNYNLGGGSINLSETVNISLTQTNGNSTDLIGTNITIVDDDNVILLSTTWQGTEITTQIPGGTQYTIFVDSIAGYYVKNSKKYVAKIQYERSITFNYITTGAFVEATDGTLYTSSAWSSSGKIANSVVVIGTNHTYRIALNGSSYRDKPIHSNSSDKMNQYLPQLSVVGDAYEDWDGKKNTEKILNFNIQFGSNTTSYAAPYCINYVFPDGKTHGYIPSAGQAHYTALNSSIIKACMEAAGGTTVGGWHTTSTLASSDSNCMYVNSGYYGDITWGGSVPISFNTSVIPYADYD